MSLTVKELKDFIADLHDDTEVVLATVIVGDEQFCSDVMDISSIESFSPQRFRRLVLTPEEISIDSDDE